jgi:hypothetical protein
LDETRGAAKRKLTFSIFHPFDVISFANPHFGILAAVRAIVVDRHA